MSSFSRALHDRGWVANHDGNVSARHGDGFLITPTAVSKRLCGPELIVLCDASGKGVSGSGKGKGRPPSEVALHAGAYRARPGIGAVIHAHPPHASAFALAQQSLGAVAMPEVVVSLGDRIPLAPLLLPKDPNAFDVAREVMSQADVALLAGNGILVAGDDLEQAYLRAELLEHYARIVWIARSIGGPAELSGDARGKLLDMRTKAGLGVAAAPVASSIRPIVAEEVRRVLGGDKK